MQPEKNQKSNPNYGKKKKPKKTSLINNFRDDEVKKKALYKVWMPIKDEFKHKYSINPMVYYGYVKKAEGGLKQLMRLIAGKKNEMKFCRIYDLTTNEIFLVVQGNNQNQQKTKTDD